MSCLIKGCNFLLKNISDEAFVYQRHGNPEYKFQTADPNIFPYLLVNIGSGVSIMKVIFARFIMMFLYHIMGSVSQFIQNHISIIIQVNLLACHILSGAAFPFKVM